ncbi:MAG: hypothetical protein ACFE92_17440 [Promethearchaeota archaeon]
MTESVIISIFKVINIAEINNMSLFDYGRSIFNYFSNDDNSDFYKRFFKWFNYYKIEKTNTSFLKDFDKSFQEFFLFDI